MMMPWWSVNPYPRRPWREAEDEVRKKYPGIIEGSNGWSRAVRNRLKKIERHRAAGRK